MPFLTNISTSSETDETLATLYSESGNLETLSVLYQRYMDLVYGVCLKYLEDSENAKDSVIAIFEELVVKLRKHEVTYFKGWLYQLAKNHCLMIIRSNKKFTKSAVDVSLMQNEVSLHLDGVMEKEMQLNQMQACLDQLVSEQKQTVELFYLQQKCYNEIVEITGIEWNKVRSFIQNGRRNLKICMDKQLSEN